MKLKIDRKPNVRVSTIDKYNLVKYAKSKGYDVSFIEVNKINKAVRDKVDSQIATQVEKPL